MGNNNRSFDGDHLFGNGFGVALTTPFQPDGTLDEEALIQIVQNVVEGGADFLVALGSTGEAAMLDEDERKRIVAIIAQHRNNARLIVGTGSPATAATCKWTNIAQEQGADGVLIAVPPYTKPPQAGIVAHFSAVAESAPKLPIIAYNVPSRTGVNLTPKTMLQLWKIPNVIGLKESSGDLTQIAQIAVEMPSDRFLFAGDDALLLPTIAVGGHGVISVAGNLIPQVMHDLLSAARASDLEVAQQRATDIQPLLNALNLEPNPIPIKAALSLTGIANSMPRLPLLPASKTTRQAIKTALHQIKSFTSHV